MSGYNWSSDNTAEIAKGWILKGNTIEALAAALKVDPAVLATTVNKYNSYAAAGADPDFEREPTSMTPLKKPLYAIKTWPCSPNTQGGPLHNQKCQVLDVWRNPIPRLYSAGELGSMFAWLYQGYGSMAECLGSGRTAGKNAAAEAPWG
jgi:succinate dehydrogenase/fumarate reductase flavoprotein subunit